MSRNKRETIEQRRAVVESEYAAGNLTTARARELAAMYGVNERQIWVDRRWVIDQVAEQVDMAPKPTKVGLIIRARELYRQCLEMGHTATAARLLSFEADILGAKEPLKLDVTHRLETMDPVELARKMLDPEAIAWARQQLIEAGEDVPVLDVEFEEVK